MPKIGYEFMYFCPFFCVDFLEKRDVTVVIVCVGFRKVFFTAD